MRPRHKAAENARPDSPTPASLPASMRPRHKAAENGLIDERPARTAACFNEAAA